MSNSGDQWHPGANKDLGLADPYHSPNEEGFFTAGNSWTGGATALDNKGLYGVTEAVTLYISGKTSNDVGVWIYARDTGGKYAGALDAGAGANGIPPILAGQKAASATMPVYWFTSAPASKLLRVMHAGAATLPVGIELSEGQ